MIHFYKLTVDDIRQETEDCVSIALSVPADLKEIFVYHHGQYLTIRAYINGVEVRRSYSICSSPVDDELRIAVKKVDNGVFSYYANHQLKKGDVLEAMPPLGKFFTRLDEAHKKLYVAIAAGSGITPIFSIIKTTLLTEPNSQVVLVYGNQSRKSIIFKEDIDAFKNRFMARFSVVHILSREQLDTPLNFGRINMEKCETLFSKIINPNNVDEFFICGPGKMTETVSGFLQDKGVEKKRIHFELFTTGDLTKTPSSPNKENSKTPAHTSEVSVKLDGALFNFKMAAYDSSILEAAQMHGADLPFSCKSGVCCTCKARLLQGEVEMDVNYGLEPEEVEQGFVLTCQSHPRSKTVVLDFDLK